MSQQTFEQALHQTLANSRLLRMIEDDECAIWWNECWVADRAAVENVIDKLCQDLSKIIGRRVSRRSTVSTRLILVSGTFESRALSAFAHLNRSVKHFVKNVFDNIKCNTDSPIPFPISKICWEKNHVTASLPNGYGMVEHIRVVDPTKRTVAKDDPDNVKSIVKICATTHFDYQPYILEDDCNKILVLKLGNDWPDLVVSDFKNDFSSLKSEMLFPLICFFWSFGGCLASCAIESQWLEIVILFSSIIIGAMGGLWMSMLMTKFYKSLRL